jgi:tetratricopeptide (TPR) repeat protein
MHGDQRVQSLAEDRQVKRPTAIRHAVLLMLFLLPLPALAYSETESSLAPLLRGDSEVPSADLPALQAAVDQHPQDGDNLWRLAIASFKAGQHDVAADAFRRYLALSPNQRGAHPVSDAGIGADLALALQRAGKTDAALAALREAAHLAPRDQDLQLRLADLLVDAQKAAEAEPLVKSLINPAQAKADLFNTLGRAYYGESRGTEALAAFSKAIDIDAGKAAYWKNRGTIRHRLGNSGAAETDLRQAIKLNPDDADAYYFLGQAVDSQCGMLEAQDALHRAVQLRPDVSAYQSGEGYCQARRREWPQALQSAQRAIELDPQSWFAYYVRAWAYYEQGEYAKAATDFRPAHALEPGNSEAAFWLGRSLQLSHGKMDDAIKAYRESIAINPGYLDAHVYLAEILNNSGQHEAALTELDAALKLDSKNVWAIGTKATILSKLKRYDEAIAMQQTAITLNPQSGDAYDHLAQIQRVAGKWAESEQSSMKAVALDPANVDYLVQLAQTQIHENKLDAAAAALKTAQQASKTDTSSLHEALAELAGARHDVALTLTEANRAIDLDNDNNLALALRLGALMDLGRFAEALETNRRLCAMFPDSGSLQLTLAWILVNQHDYDPAAAALDRADKLLPNDPDVQNTRGYVLLGQGKPDAAVAVFRKAISLAPDDASIRQSLGDGLRALGKLDEAEAANRQALKMAPELAGAYRGLGDIESDRKNWSQAIIDYRKAIELGVIKFDSYRGLAKALRATGQDDEAAKVEAQLAQLNKSPQ